MSYYTGATVTPEFTKRWRSKKHVGNATPWGQVLVRRGNFRRSFHTNWPDPQFGQIVGHSIRDQWYPTWTPEDDWTELPGVGKIDLDQSFDKNGIMVATIDAENLAFQAATGAGGTYHTRERGYLWPWRGYTPKGHPGSNQAKNAWYNRLPNAQILVRQGYGQDTAVKTFTGLIDNVRGGVRPDRMTITSRDFGGVLVDSHVFGWNKDKRINDPITFVPHNYDRIQLLSTGKTHRWIKIKDATDIVRCALRWCGFKQWEIQDSGVDLSQPLSIGKDKTWMDVINMVAAQLGYVFFIAEPTSDDLSIGRPIFRPSQAVVQSRGTPITIRDNDLLTDLKPTHDNTEERYIIRVRGTIASKKQGGRTIVPGDSGEDGQLRYTFTYWPPGISRMAGVIKQLTYYNIGDAGTLGFTNTQQCRVAAVLIGLQIALKKDVAVAQCPGNPAMGCDSYAYIIDSGTGVTSRLYVTNRKSVMTLDPSGSGAGLLWATEFGGALTDNPYFDHLRSDYHKAVTGQKVLSGGPNS